MAVSITNTLISALNADQTLTKCAATSSTLNEAEVFTYTPTGKDHKVLIGFYVGDSHGAVAYSIAAGAGVRKRIYRGFDFGGRRADCVMLRLPAGSILFVGTATERETWLCILPEGGSVTDDGDILLQGTGSL
jgi:hypothetical protein